MYICRPLQSVDTSRNDSKSLTLEETKYTWSPSSRKLEGTRPTSPIGRLRPIQPRHKIFQKNVFETFENVLSSIQLEVDGKRNGSASARARTDVRTHTHTDGQTDNIMHPAPYGQYVGTHSQVVQYIGLHGTAHHFRRGQASYCQRTESGGGVLGEGAASPASLTSSSSTATSRRHCMFQSSYTSP